MNFVKVSGYCIGLRFICSLELSNLGYTGSVGKIQSRVVLNSKVVQVVVLIDR